MIAIIAAIVLDIILGDPLWFPHPIIFIGKLISMLEKWLYKKESKLRGLLLVILCCTVVFAVIQVIVYLSSVINIDKYIMTFFLYTSLAIKSLAKAGKEISDALNIGIDKARLKLSYIIGRDTNQLDEQEILKATVETIAENTIDGIIAPIFYMLIGLIFNMPLQFVFVYKAVNTMDSMIGYKNDKYSNFGFFAAKLDDVLNFIPARIGSIIMLIAGLLSGYDFRNGCRVFARDRKNHKSPNSAHPESAVAGLLNIRLGGPNFYFGKLVDKPYIGDGERKLNANDIINTNKILYISTIIVLISLVVTEVII